MNWMTRMKIMPLMIIVAALSFGVRFGEFVTGFSVEPGVAQATEAKPDTASGDSSDKPDEHSKEAKSDVPKSNEDEPRTVPLPDLDEDGEKIEWKDSSDAELEYSGVRMELFEDLSARREGLESREREIVVRESLLKVAEREIDQKYKELVSLRAELQDLLQEQSDEEKSRIESLVKIYEGMKPKDAARIFNTLDVDILLQVMSEMSERKTAPIMAAMNAERAQTVTIMLLEQKSLPEISDGFIP